MVILILVLLIWRSCVVIMYFVGCVVKMKRYVLFLFSISERMVIVFCDDLLMFDVYDGYFDVNLCI